MMIKDTEINCKSSQLGDIMGKEMALEMAHPRKKLATNPQQMALTQEWKTKYNMQEWVLYCLPQFLSPLDAFPGTLVCRPVHYESYSILDRLCTAVQTIQSYVRRRQLATNIIYCMEVIHPHKIGCGQNCPCCRSLAAHILSLNDLSLGTCLVCDLIEKDSDKIQNLSLSLQPL